MTDEELAQVGQFAIRARSIVDRIEQLAQFYGPVEATRVAETLLRLELSLARFTERLQQDAMTRRSKATVVEAGRATKRRQASRDRLARHEAAHLEIQAENAEWTALKAAQTVRTDA